MKRRMSYRKAEETVVTVASFAGSEEDDGFKAGGDTGMAEARRGFRELMLNPTGKYYFEQFLKLENLDHLLQFWVDVERFKKTSSAAAVNKEAANLIFSTYLAEDAPAKVPITPKDSRHIKKHMLSPKRDLFSSTQRETFDTLFNDSYGRFIYMVLQKKAQGKLKGAEQQEQGFFGLGECFCLTDPSLPDNPIVGASDGFVKVTGYPRETIMNQNCRFLQGEGSSAKSVKRIGKGIREGKDVTEFLLNYKMDGTPFWNLLHICPLRNQKGEIVFFLGGQVDVTKNVNNHTPLRDILACLESLPDPSQGPQGGKPKSKEKEKERNTGLSKFLSVFGKKSSRKEENFQALGGAEERVVNPEADLETQKESFLGTYSNFIVLDGAETPGSIMFVSQAFSELSGHPMNSLLGKNYSCLFGEKTQRSHLSEIKSAMKKGLPWSKEVICYDSSRQPRSTFTFITPIKDLTNKPKVFIMIMDWKEGLSKEISLGSQE